MALNVRQRQHLKALAHHRKPVVQVGNAGITAAVIKEIELALGHHELLKIRLPGVEREARTPPGTCTSTMSPNSLPMRARAIGELMEIMPCAMLASKSPTI